MEILITGGSGFIGRNLVEYLSGSHVVHSPTRNELDLLDERAADAYFRAHSFDVVIHAAGKPGHRNAADPTGIFYADTRMYLTLLRNRDYFGKLLITGSGAIYDMRCYRPKMKEEEWKLNMPRDEHGFFRYVTAHHIEKSYEVVDLRLFGVFGKYEDYAIRFISNAICKTLFDLPVTIKQNRKFDYLYINDFLRVVDYFIHHMPRYHEYNVTPDSSIELLELARKVIAVSGKVLPVLMQQDGMGMEYSGDNGRLREEIPDIVFTPLDESIVQLYEWYFLNRKSIDSNCLLTDK
jgi:GDP-L-fucose synthase